MKKVWHISTSIAQVKDTGHYRLWIRSAEDLKRFLRIIIPHIPVEDMIYKVILLYKDSQLQQRWISEIANLGSFPKVQITKKMQEKKAKWKKFRE